MPPQSAIPTYTFATSTALALEATFDGGRLTSDGGLPWLAAAEDEVGICAALAACVPEWRRGPVQHTIAALVRQRVFGIACGYEDQNDADTLRSDPLLKLVCGRCPESDADLASQPTMSRLENAVDRHACARLAHALLDIYLRAPEQDGRPSHIVLDIDSTDDPTHGAQEGTACTVFVLRHPPVVLTSSPDLRRRMLWTQGMDRLGVVTMEEEFYADRAALRRLQQTHPDWTQRELATHLGRSIGWIKKWTKRLRAAPPDDTSVLWSRSRARKHPPPSVPAAVVARILEIRDQPPEGLRRVPGPRAILYYLHRDPELRAQGVALPRSTRTIWRILTRHGRIVHRRSPDHHPVERPLPLTSWQLDFKDAATVPVDPDGKRAHSVEVLNTVDVGTSLLLDAQVHEAYTAETSLRAVAQLVQEHGLPDHVTFDRDPRFVGAVQNRDFPAPFVRFWTCLGVDVTVCPPHRPDKNAFVERYHRSYNSECLQVERPRTTEEVRAVTAAYKVHYNHQRPNQALSCGNRPPGVAFPTLPARPPIPLIVDPDAWLQSIDGCSFVRKVQRNGSVTVDYATYYIGLEWVGRSVGLQVDAPAREFVVVHAGQELKRPSIKGLVQQLVTFDAFVDLLAEQARIDRGAHVTLTG